MTKHHILTGFNDTGIWPVDRTKVLVQLTDKQRIIDTSRYPLLLPAENCHIQAKAAIVHIKHKYAPDFSSPSQWAFGIVESTLEEGTLLYGASQVQALATKQKKDKIDNTIQ